MPHLSVTRSSAKKSTASVTEGKLAKAVQGSGVVAMTTWGANLRGVLPPVAGGGLPVQLLVESHAPDISLAGHKRSALTPNSSAPRGPQVIATRSAADNAVRRLDEFLTNFPVDRPATAKPRAASGLTDSHHTPDPTGTSATRVDDELRRVEHDLQARRQAKEAVQKSYDMLRRHKVDDWVQRAEKHNKRLRRENDMLEKIVEITQRAAVDNDMRYEEALSAMQAQMEYAGLYRSDDSDTTVFIRESISDIQDRLAEIQHTSESEVHAELTNIRSGFEAQVQQRTQELDQARAAGQSTTAQWVEESRALQKELEKILADTDEAQTEFRRLSRRHQRLRIEHEAQQDDAVLLARQWTLVSTQHNNLKDKIQEVDLAIAAARQGREKAVTGDGSGHRVEESYHTLLPDHNHVNTGADAADDTDDLKRLDTALQRAEALLTSEKHSLAAVRKAHLHALQQRTELEVYLRCAVLRHQQRLLHLHYADREGRRASSGGFTIGGAAGKSHPIAPPVSTDRLSISSTSFTADDRRVVIESLLAVPRVLQLIYRGAGKATSASIRSDLIAVGAPSEAILSAAASHDDPSAAEEGAVGHRDSPDDDVITEAALEKLWQRWLQWTATAEATFTARPSSAQRAKP